MINVGLMTHIVSQAHKQSSKKILASHRSILEVRKLFHACTFIIMKHIIIKVNIFTDIDFLVKH